MTKTMIKLNSKKLGYRSLHNGISFAATVSVIGIGGNENIYLHNLILIIAAVPFIIFGILVHWLLSKVFFSKKYKNIDKEKKMWIEERIANKILVERNRLEIVKIKKDTMKKIKKAKTKEEILQVVHLGAHTQFSGAPIAQVESKPKEDQNIHVNINMPDMKSNNLNEMKFIDTNEVEDNKVLGVGED